MDLSEFDGLEPVSEHELKTLIQHLPDGALGLFERRLILRILELEQALTESPCDNRAEHSVDYDSLCDCWDDVGPIDTSSLGEEATITINFGSADYDVQPMDVEEFTRAIEATMRKYGRGI